MKYLSRGRGYSVSLGSRDVIIGLGDERIRMTFVGGRGDATLAGVDELPGRINYLLGRDPSAWRTGVPTYAKVKYSDVYPGIDAVVYGSQTEIEYDFVVAPGADPSRIGLRLTGGARPEFGADGDLRITTKRGTLIQRRPVIYQEIDGRRVAVSGGYVKRGPNQVGFRLGAYDRTRALIIDPVIVYSTFLGGGGWDETRKITVDGAGNAYVVGGASGQPGSDPFPWTNGSPPPSDTGVGFIAKLDASGGTLIFASYIDGGPSAIALDAAGNIFVGGGTLSTTFPTTAGSFQPVAPNSSTANGFVMKLNPAGNTIIWATYLGGPRSSGPGDGVASLAVDATGVYVAGSTASSAFPVTSGAAQPIFGGGFADGFVTKLNSTGSAVIYSTYLGGEAGDNIFGLALDVAGNVFVTGYTQSSGFPVTAGAFQTTLAGWNPFVTKLNAEGALVYSTFVGGTGEDVAVAIDVDRNGNAYVTGWTASSDFPLVNPYATFQGVRSGFVFKLNSIGSALVYSTYLPETEVGGGIAVDASGAAYVTGETMSGNFPQINPIMSKACDPVVSCAYVTKLNAVGQVTANEYSVIVGSSAGDKMVAWGLALDASGNVYVVGRAGSGYTTTPGSFDVSAGSTGSDGFITKLSGGSSGGTPPPMTVSIANPAGGSTVSGTVSVTATVINASGTPISFVLKTDDGKANTSSTSAATTATLQWETRLNSNGLHTVSVTATDATGHTASAVVTVTVSNPIGGTPTVSITSPASGAWTGNSIEIKATASSSTRLASLKLWGNGAAFATVPCSGTTCGADVWWVTGSLPRAAYLVHAVATDTEGKCAVSAPITINKDETAPVVASGASCGASAPPSALTAAVTGPANGTTVSGTVTVNMTASNAQSTPTFTLRVDNGATLATAASGSAATASWNTAGVANGPHTLNLTVTDGARTATAAVSVTVNNTTGGTGGDTTAPAVRITSPSSNVWTGNSINIAASASDNVALANIKLWGNGAVFASVPCNGASCSGNVTWVTGSLPPAAYEVNAVATDTAGNQTVSAKVTIFKDATSPVKPSGATATGGGGTPPPPLGAAITSPTNGAGVSGTVTVNMAASNAQGTPTYTLTVDNGTTLPTMASGSTATASWNTAGVATGNHTLNLTVTDGARTATAAVTVAVSNTTGGTGGDTTAPSVVITKPSNGAWTGNSIDVTASASDNVGVASLKFFGNGTQFAQVSCSGTSCTSTQWWLTGSLPPGKHTITVVATDTAGNSTTSAPVLINK